jgi:hypothetical protein
VKYRCRAGIAKAGARKTIKLNQACHVQVFAFHGVGLSKVAYRLPTSYE